MPRIRTIKPEFWGDEKLAPMVAIDRLVFLGLISMADDAGRVVDSIRAINGFIFPETDETAEQSLDALEVLGRIERGVTQSGQRIIQLRHWRHQKIDKPNMAAALPPIAILSDSSKRRRKIAEKLRAAIFERDGGLCQCCGRAVRESKRDKYDADDDLGEVDHIIAVIDGGTNAPENLQLLCLSCNRKKAGENIRRRNADVSTPHSGISTSDQRSTTDDQRAKRPAISDGEASVSGAASDEPRQSPARGASGAPPSDAIGYRDLPPDVLEFGARFYRAAPAERRRTIANQLLRLARGQSVRFKRVDVGAGSLERLARKCRDVLDGQDVRKPDAAIAVLLSKLADSDDLTADRRRREETARSDENRQTADEMAYAESWLEQSPETAALIDVELTQQGYPAATTRDAILGMTRTWARRGLVLTAWRAAGSPRRAIRESA